MSPLGRTSYSKCPEISTSVPSNIVNFFQFSFRYPKMVVGSWMPKVSTPRACFTESSTSASIWKGS